MKDVVTEKVLERKARWCEEVKKSGAAWGINLPLELNPHNSYPTTTNSGDVQLKISVDASQIR